MVAGLTKRFRPGPYVCVRDCLARKLVAGPSLPYEMAFRLEGFLAIEELFDGCLHQVMRGSVSHLAKPLQSLLYFVAESHTHRGIGHLWPPV